MIYYCKISSLVRLFGLEALSLVIYCNAREMRSGNKLEAVHKLSHSANGRETDVKFSKVLFTKIENASQEDWNAKEEGEDEGCSSSG